MKRKILLVFIFFLLGIVRLLILILPFRYLTKIMGKEIIESAEDVSPKLIVKAEKIGWAVNRMSGFTPWKSQCFAQALTAMIILKILMIPCTLYFGVAKDQSNKLIAHAWLRCGNRIVTGRMEKDRFKTISQFSNL